MMATAAAERNAAVLAADVVTALGTHRHRGGNEKQIQDSVERVLAAAGLVFSREHALSAQDRPDFLVDGGVVVEVKMRASRSMVLMQLGRYASHDQVAALVLASPRLTVVSGMPDSIHGKPVRVVQLPGVGLA